jgi:glycosyltransferase involved in cell wall biosynthesis
MPRILAHVHAYIGHGREAGAETTLANLLESLVEAGWDAEVVLPEADKDRPSLDYWINNVHVISENLTGHNFQSYAKRADVLITHLECSERTAYIGRPNGIPVVQLIHNTFWQTEGYLREGCDLAVYNSNWVAAHHFGEKDYATRLISRVNDELAQITFKAPTRMTWPHVVVHPQVDPKEYEIKGGLHDHITLVNLYENKGPDVFWELARRFPDQRFLAVKGGYGKQEIPDDIPSNVLVVKNTKDMKIIYGMTKVLLMPSQYESFGRVAIEAAASGVPTIASPTPGLVEALGPQAPYCDPDSIDDWELELTILLGNDITYQSASKYAKSRSDYWDSVRPAETENFVAAINNFLR